MLWDRQSRYCPARLRIAAASLLFAVAPCLLRAQEVVQQLPPNLAGPEQTANFTLHGTVVNRVTQQPIPHALVQCNDRPDKAVLTDGDGHFEIDGLPAMESLTVKKPGYLDPNTQPQLDEPWQRGIQLTADMPDLTIALTPEAVVSGQLSLPSAEPAEGFFVSIYRRSLQDGRPLWTQAGGANTNSRGAYRFADLAPGTYYVASQARTDTDAVNVLAPGGTGHGFPPAFYGSGPEFSPSALFTLTPGQHFQADLALSRESFHQVTASVTNSQPGDPLQPEVVDQGNHSTGFPVIYDNQHQLIRAALPNGTYTLRARSFGKMQRLGQVSFTLAEKPLTALTVALLPVVNVPVTVRRDFSESSEEPEGPVTMARMQQPPQGADDPPQEAARVVHMPQIMMYLSAVDGSGNQGNLQGVPGSQDEAVELTGINPGRYWVQAQAVQEGYVASISCDGVDLTREPLVIGPSGASGPIEVTLRNDGGTLNITLAESQDSSASGIRSAAFLYVVPQFDFVGPISHQILDSLGSTQITGFNGGFGMSRSSEPKAVVGGLAPGSYRVYAFATPHDLEYRSPDAMQPYADQSQVVTVAAHETTSIEVKLPSSAE